MIQAFCFCHKGDLDLRDTVVTHSPSCRKPEVSFVLETFKEIQSKENSKLSLYVHLKIIAVQKLPYL